MEVVLIMFLFMINILAHFFEPPHSIFLRQQKEIQETGRLILKSNEEIINLLKERL